MRTRLLMLVAMLGALVAFSGSLQAEVVIYEPFDYDTPNLDGNDGGTGFAGPWYGGDRNADIPEDGLEWGDLPTTGSCMQGPGISDPSRPLGSQLADNGLLEDGATLWFSYIVDCTGHNMTNLDFNFALSTDPFEAKWPPQLSYDNKEKIQNNGEGFGVSNTQGYTKGAYWQDDGNNDGWAEKHAFDSTLPRLNADVNSRALIVGRIDWGSSGETLTLYAPGTDLILGEPILTMTTPVNLDQTQFDTLAIGWKDNPSLDEIRFGKYPWDVLGDKDPMDPNPADGESIIATDQLRLSWTHEIPTPPATETIVDLWWGTEPNVLSDGYNMVRIVTEGTDNFFEFVDSSDLDTYYWRVDSYLNGPGHVNEPNRVEGRLWSYTTFADLPPVIDSLTPDQMIWSGGDVPLAADVTNLGPAATTYQWTAETTTAAEITIAGGDTATPTVTITKLSYTEALIANAGFEADQKDEDGWGSAAGWPGGGNWNPPADSYTGSAVPEGNMCAWTSGTMSQVLIETLAADTQYELTVQVGNSMRYDWPEYNVQLLAGGTVLAEDPNLNVSVPRDSWALVTVPFNSTGVDPELLGKPLEIRLSSLGNQPGDYAELNFDDVHLTADPPFTPPAVQTVTMTVAVSDAEGGAPGTDSQAMKIDVYDNPCHMARVGEGKSNPGDFDEDCDTDLDDLALMTIAWLNDIVLDGPVAK